MLLFNETLLNIMSNFIPNKLMIFDDKEPRWIDRKIKNLIKHKNQIYKDTNCRKRNHNFQFHFCYIQDLINTKIDQSKRKYYENMSRHLSDKSLNLKRYWSLLKTLLNGKKIPCIPPLYHNNKFISEIKAKCELFNSYFAGQCTPLVNNSQLPTRFTTHTDSILTSIDFFVEQVSNIIKKLGPNKVHGHGKISIRMLKLCRDSINRPLATIFKNCFNERIFPNDWKKANVVSIHKKLISIL